MSCHTDKKNEIRIIEVQENNTIKCTEKGCRGIYTGSEFINGKDIAHQFSNKMSTAVGMKLKEFYQEKRFKFNSNDNRRNGKWKSNLYPFYSFCFC